MNKATQQNDIATRQVVYKIEGMDSVNIRKNLAYRTSDLGSHSMDIYSPINLEQADRKPAVIFIFGFSDPFFGANLKEMGAYISWAKLAAASGIIAITYSYKAPVEDLATLIEFLQENAEALGIDESRIGIWACSGIVPLALSVLIQKRIKPFKCAALCYGYMLDLKDSNVVSEAATKFGFVNPCTKNSIDDLPKETSIFLVRAGQDQMPAINKTIDHFVEAALERNLALSLVNHPTAPHAFDLFDDSETSRTIIKSVLAFLQSNLLD